MTDKDVEAWIGLSLIVDGAPILLHGFAPSDARYVTLGPGGAWAGEALSAGVIPFGYAQVPHELCQRGDWDRVRDALVAAGRTLAGAAQGVRELRDYYGLDETVLWIAFARGHLWWTFADPEVVWSPDAASGLASRLRRARGGWCSTDLLGAHLALTSLSAALTRIGAYRMTLCAVERRDYLYRRIRGEADPLQIEAAQLRHRLQETAAALIAGLHWRDFETLVDLVFQRGGWRRTSMLGGVLPDVDLLLEQPLSGETAWVQVKARASQAALDDSLARFRQYGTCDRFFFACHSPYGRLTLAEQAGLHLWTAPVLAERALELGLLDWIIERAA